MYLLALGFVVLCTSPAIAQESGSSREYITEINDCSVGDRILVPASYEGQVTVSVGFSSYFDQVCLCYQNDELAKQDLMQWAARNVEIGSEESCHNTNGLGERMSGFKVLLPESAENTRSTPMACYTSQEVQEYCLDALERARNEAGNG